jgi:hypothetical protein
LRAAGIGFSNDSSESPNETCSYGQWWTCTDQTPSFQGCCLTDPCRGDNTGCPAGQLYPAAFASVTTAATSSSAASTSTSKPQTTSKSTQTSSSATSSSTTSSSSSSATASPANLTAASTTSSTAPSSHSLSKTQVHAIAGGAAAAGVGIFLLIALFLTWHRARSSRKAHISQPPLPSTSSPRPPSPFPPEMSQHRPSNPRTPLPSLQTHLSKTTPRQRTHSMYSAYSPNHITPSSFDSQYSSTEQFVERPSVRHSADEAYYPGRPIFGVPHAIQTPEAAAQPRQSLGLDTQRPSPPPAYGLPQSSPTSPRAGAGPRTQYPPPPTAAASSRRPSNHCQYPRHDGACEAGAGIAPAAAAGVRSSRRRSSGQQYNPRPRQTIHQVHSERGLGSHESRRNSEPLSSHPIYETPDQVPSLPNSPSHAQNLQLDRIQPVGTQELRTRGMGVKTMSWNAVSGNGTWSASPDMQETVESTNAAGTGWGGDMRTDRERQRDLQLLLQWERERSWRARG